MLLCRHHFIFIIQPENNFCYNTTVRQGPDMNIQIFWYYDGFYMYRYISVTVITLHEISYTDRNNQWTILYPKPEMSNCPPFPSQLSSYCLPPQVILLTQFHKTCQYRLYTNKSFVLYSRSWVEYISYFCGCLLRSILFICTAGYLKRDA